MAVWGAPTTTRTTPRGPCVPRWTLVEAVRTLGPTINARAGVLTGERPVTLGARHQGWSQGDL